MCEHLPCLWQAACWGQRLPPSGTCVLQQSLWGIGSVYYLHQLMQHHGNVWLHFGPCPEMMRNKGVISNTPIATNVAVRHDYEWEREDSPICIDISPIAHVALLHTDINSGFKLVPSMGIKSAGKKSRAHQSGEQCLHSFRDGASASRSYRCKV